MKNLVCRDHYVTAYTVRIFGVSIWVRPICRAAAQCQAGLTACPSFSTPAVVSIHPPTRALRSLRGRRRQLLQSYHRLSSTISRWSRRVAMIFTRSRERARTACCRLRGQIRIACGGLLGIGGSSSSVCASSCTCVRVQHNLGCERVSSCSGRERCAQ